ncbi:hypothetical protein GRJ2_003126500 [Grus japonensis]|uniref:Uncharacterized protein n=1 Tax=Grus japonensis TaxID=30415 RepID=A0ABC9Y973_GRUJA
MEKTMVRQAAPLQPMEVNGGADIHPAAHRGLHTEASECPKEAVTPWEGRTGAGSWLLAGPVDPWREESMLEQVLLAGLVTPWKGLTLEQFMKNCHPWEGLTLEKFMEDCLPWEGPHAGAGDKCEESSP